MLFWVACGSSDRYDYVCFEQVSSIPITTASVFHVAGLPVQLIMKKHEWRETTEDGEVRLVTATRHAGKWQLRSRLKSEDEWTNFPVIELDDLESLLEVITNKYQRDRVPHGHVLEIEALIAARSRK